MGRLTTASMNSMHRLSSCLVSQYWRKSRRPMGCLSQRLVKSLSVGDKQTLVCRSFTMVTYCRHLCLYDPPLLALAGNGSKASTHFMPQFPMQQNDRQSNLTLFFTNQGPDSQTYLQTIFLRRRSFPRRNSTTFYSTFLRMLNHILPRTSHMAPKWD